MSPSEDREDDTPDGEPDAQQGEPNLESLLGAVPELLGAALTDRNGKLLSQEGDLDAKALCAFSVIAQKTVREAVEELSLGTPERWCFSTDSACWYSVLLGAKRLIAVGEPTKHPAATLHKLPKAGGSQP
jgi:hypothetical protein